MRAGSIELRRRLPAAIVGFAAFILLAQQTASDFWAEPWFAVAAAMTISATFVEPFFARPHDVIVNAVAAAFAFFSFDWEPYSGLWFSYFAFVVTVLVAALFAAVAEDSPGLKPLARRYAAGVWSRRRSRNRPPSPRRLQQSRSR